MKLKDISGLAHAIQSVLKDGSGELTSNGNGTILRKKATGQTFIIPDEVTSYMVEQRMIIRKDLH